LSPDVFFRSQNGQNVLADGELIALPTTPSWNQWERPREGTRKRKEGKGRVSDSDRGGIKEVKRGKRRDGEKGRKGEEDVCPP